MGNLPSHLTKGCVPLTGESMDAQRRATEAGEDKALLSARGVGGGVNRIIGRKEKDPNAPFEFVCEHGGVEYSFSLEKKTEEGKQRLILYCESKELSDLSKAITSYWRSREFVNEDLETFMRFLVGDMGGDFDEQEKRLSFPSDHAKSEGQGVRLAFTNFLRSQNNKRRRGLNDFRR